MESAQLARIAERLRDSAGPLNEKGRGHLQLLVGVGLTFSWVYLDLPLGPGAVVKYTLPAPAAPAP